MNKNKTAESLLPGIDIGWHGLPAEIVGPRGNRAGPARSPIALCKKAPNRTAVPGVWDGTAAPWLRASAPRGRAMKTFHDAQYQVFQKMCADFDRYRAIMRGDENVL